MEDSYTTFQLVMLKARKKPRIGITGSQKNAPVSLSPKNSDRRHKSISNKLSSFKLTGQTNVGFGSSGFEATQSI